MHGDVPVLAAVLPAADRTAVLVVPVLADRALYIPVRRLGYAEKSHPAGVHSGYTYASPAHCVFTGEDPCHAGHFCCSHGSLQFIDPRGIYIGPQRV